MNCLELCLAVASVALGWDIGRGINSSLDRLLADKAHSVRNTILYFVFAIIFGVCMQGVDLPF